MKLLPILRKHYLDTTLLVISLAFLSYSGWELYRPKNNPALGPQVQTTEPDSAEKILENNIENNKDAPQLKIPETVKPTSTENQNKNIESAKVSDKTAEPNATSTPVETDFLRASLVINGKSYPIALIGSSSVYDVMQSFNEVGKIKVDFKDYSGLGYFVDGIDGVKSDTLRAKYWIYYINGAKAQVGISNYQLKSGDIITWKYESAE